MRFSIRQDKSHLLLWLLSPLIGIVVGYGVIGFIAAINFIHELWIGGDMKTIVAATMLAPWWQVMIGPVLVGVIAACVVRFLPPAGRPLGVADVLLAKDLKDQHLTPKAGLASTVYAALCLGGGGSAGRESPAIHLGAVLATSMARFFNFSSGATRILLACGAGAAVSASFNAPLAGMLFAHEVILRHIAPYAIMPIALASVAAAAITRIHLGSDFSAFPITDFHFTPTLYSQLPYFILLGMLCAVVAAAFIVLTFRLVELEKRLPGPDWTRPLFIGLLTACVGLLAPRALGVGYEVTASALSLELPLRLLLLLIGLKLVLTSATLAGRFGGGVFSPSLYLGALTGAAFGLTLEQLMDVISPHYILYAIAGMGGVAAAVLGAPISTILIAFELIGDYQTTLALMITVATAAALVHLFLGGGFFQLQADKMSGKTT